MVLLFCCFVVLLFCCHIGVFKKKASLQLTKTKSGSFLSFKAVTKRRSSCFRKEEAVLFLWCCSSWRRALLLFQKAVLFSFNYQLMVRFWNKKKSGSFLKHTVWRKEGFFFFFQEEEEQEEPFFKQEAPWKGKTPCFLSEEAGTTPCFMSGSWRMVLLVLLLLERRSLLFWAVLLLGFFFLKEEAFFSDRFLSLLFWAVLEPSFLSGSWAFFPAAFFWKRRRKQEKEEWFFFSETLAASETHGKQRESSQGSSSFLEPPFFCIIFF